MIGPRSKRKHATHACAHRTRTRTAAGRKVLTKSGRVDDLWQHLTTHYGLDLTAAPPAAAVATPASGVLLTLDIQNVGFRASMCAATNVNGQLRYFVSFVLNMYAGGSKNAL